jgi:hypothetical protein
MIFLVGASIFMANKPPTPEDFDDKPIAEQVAFFGNYTDAYIFYGLYHGYIISFVFVLIFTLLLFPMLFGKSLRILLLRPFGEKTLTKSLKSLILRNIAGVGYIYTLSDKNFKPNILVTVVTFYANILLFIFNPIFRGSLRVSQVKNDRTFHKLAKVMLSELTLRVRNVASCGQAFNIRCTDSWWKCCVSLLTNSCEIIVVDISKVKEGTEWEIIELVKRNLSDRCVFISALDSSEHARKVITKHFGENTAIKIHFYDDERGELCEPIVFRDSLNELIARAIARNCKDDNEPAAQTAAA